MVWRRGRSGRRIKVGLITKNQTEGVVFRYLTEGLKEAMSEGFTMYPDFPNTETIYKQNVLETLAQRLTNTERSDIKKYYDYWGIAPEMKDDKYYVLAQTQGLLPTDYFEFIAEYFPKKGLKFTSEICGLSHTKIPSGSLSVGDVLTWKFEKNNSYDPHAVLLYKEDVKLGYVKTIHNRIFHTSKNKQFSIIVKSVEQNGHINRVFIAISKLSKDTRIK